MKKSVITLIALVLLMMFAACESKNNTVTENEKVTEKDLVGNYVDISLKVPLGIYADFLTSGNGMTANRQAIVIEEKDGELVFQDNMFRGTCDLFDDGGVILKRKEVIADGTMKNLAELTMEQVPLVSYTYYSDYLISDSNMSFSVVSGQLLEGKKSNCVLGLEHITLKDYRLTFSEKGTCEMECTGVSSEKYHFEGTYECDGKLVLLTFAEGNIDGQDYNGESKMVLYIDEGKVCDSVYKKK